MSGSDYRPFLPAPGTAKIAGPTPRAHTEARTKNNPRAQGLLANWEKMLNGPFRGITIDGHVIPELYAPRPEGAPTQAMIEAANALLAAMSPEQKKTSCFAVDSNQWRRWQNTELYLEHYGFRLDEIDEPVRYAVLAVMRVSMSQHGYDLARDVMKLNRFLGDIVHGPAV